MLWLLDFFRDPRYRRERITWIIVIPGVVLLVAAVCIIFYFRESAWRDAELARRAREEAALAVAPTKRDRLLSPEEQVSEAAFAFRTGKVGEAKELLSGVNLEKIASPEAWTLAGQVQAAEKNTAAAAETFTRGIAATPTAELYYRRALLYRDTGDFEKARKDFEQAAVMEPNNALYPNERLLLLLQLGQKDQVKAEVTSAILSKAEPKFWVFGLAGLALEKGQYPEAADLLGKGQPMVDKKTFQQLMSSPAFSRYQSRPEIFSFFFSNAPAGATSPAPK